MAQRVLSTHRGKNRESCDSIKTPQMGIPLQSVRIYAGRAGRIAGNHLATHRLTVAGNLQRP